MARKIQNFHFPKTLIFELFSEIGKTFFFDFFFENFFKKKSKIFSEIIFIKIFFVKCFPNSFGYFDVGFPQKISYFFSAPAAG